MKMDDDTEQKPGLKIRGKDRKFDRVKNIDPKIRAKVLRLLEQYPNYVNRPKAIHRALNDKKITLDMVRTILQS